MGEVGAESPFLRRKAIERKSPPVRVQVIFDSITHDAFSSNQKTLTRTRALGGITSSS